MCSFLAANQLIANLAYVNFFLQPRGPDATTHLRLHGFDFVHNLLHMTGERRPQPFLSPERSVIAPRESKMYVQFHLTVQYLYIVQILFML